MEVGRAGAKGRAGGAHSIGGAGIGINVVMGVLVFTALLAERGSTRALRYRALELFAVGRELLPAFSVSPAAAIHPDGS